MQRMIFRVKTKEQLELVYKSQLANSLVIDYSLINEIKDFGPSEIIISLPDIARQERITSIEEMLELAKEKAYGILVKNLDEFAMLVEKKFTGKILADSFLYSYNCQAVEFYRSFFPDMEFLAADELSDDETKALSRSGKVKFIYKLYGHQQLMITNQCIHKNYYGCSKSKLPEAILYSDERGNKFLSVNECGQCYCTIYYASPTNMIDKASDIKADSFFVDFTLENKSQVITVLDEIRNINSGTENNKKRLSAARGYHFKGID